MIGIVKRLVFGLLPDEKKWQLKNKYAIPSMEWSLLNMKRNGFAPISIVDIGAYEGSWTKMIKQIFPQAAVLMLEAQKNKAEALKAICQKYSPTVQVDIGLIGPENKAETAFFENETVSSALPEHYATAAKKVFVPMHTLDTILEKQDFPAPTLIKLDVQGYELEVLKGAQKALSTVEAVLMEVSLIDINKGAPLFHEVIAFMHANGFITYDICSFVRRPLDKALWQVDVIFVKDQLQLASNKRYS
jgi:FkbM family methyltransferase